jgi:hypothetical protein
MIFRKKSKAATGSGPPPPILRCSFCGKAQQEVDKLIAGPRVYICDACVDICNEIIAKNGPFASPRTPSVQPELPAEVEGVILENPPIAVRPVRCRLCNLWTPLASCLPVPRRGWVCGRCLDAVKESLDALSDPDA